MACRAMATALTLQSLFRLAGSRDEMALIGGRALEVSASGAGASAEVITTPEDRGWLAQVGFGRIDGIAKRKPCAALVRAVQELRARSLPATFVYAFDEAWAIGQTARTRISAILGEDYRLCEDVWAWYIEPGSGHGWTAHRGVDRERLAREAPEVINVWVALSAVEVERACMHAVPLDEDPGYPEALDRIDAPPAASRALPASAGDALAWNANVLHWGGPCAAHAFGPRVSCSFTLCRADAAARFPELALLSPLELLDFNARMDAVARMIMVYGEAHPEDVQDVVRDWAAVTHGITTRFGQRKAP